LETAFIIDIISTSVKTGGNIALSDLAQDLEGGVLPIPFDFQIFRKIMLSF
jgi:hypothetical protein